MEKKQIHEYKYAIIGGGVVGCSILNALTMFGSCALVEKCDDVSNGTSKANSGIIHAGFDCKSNTLKAKLNLEGNRIIKKICKRLYVPLKKTGSVVVGNNEEQLQKLLYQGKVNGVKRIKIIGDKKLHTLVPNLSKDIKSALWAKNSYIVDPYGLTISLCDEAILNGAKVYTDYEVCKCKKEQDFFIISDKNGRQIKAKYLINCAGFGYSQVAKIIGSEVYDIQYRRGEYYLLDNTYSNFVSLTVFPLPSVTSKGILVTPTVENNILVGPTSYPSDDSTITTKEGLNQIEQNVKTMFPTIELKKVIRVFAGVRSIVGEDFIIEKSAICDNVVNVAGICSPGLSSAPAIAKMVAKLLGIKKIKKLPKRIKKPIITRNLTSKKLNKLIQKNPDYGKIICKCESISRGEIVDAINRPLTPISVDAIKRRVRAGMGRCQGGFCFNKVIEILAENNKMKELCVPKENVGSNFFVSEINEEVNQ